jgi:bacillithiol system protein YtxJ
MSAVVSLTEKSLPATCYVFKHSTTCGISARAAMEIEMLESDIPVYWVNVREQRELSNWVAAQYGVRHESPQLILLRNGTVQKVWNHGAIRRESITGSAAGGAPPARR